VEEEHHQLLWCLRNSRMARNIRVLHGDEVRPGQAATSRLPFARSIPFPGRFAAQPLLVQPFATRTRSWFHIYACLVPLLSIKKI